MGTNTMDVDVTKFRHSMQALMRLPDAELEECLRLWSTAPTIPTATGGAMDKAVALLATRLVDPLYTESIRDSFPDLLMLIVTRAFPSTTFKQTQADKKHVAKCVALSKLVAHSQHIKKFAQAFFTTQLPPFHAITSTKTPAPKRTKRTIESTPDHSAISDLEIVRCCHRFLHCDTAFYRTAWQWSAFLQRFWSGSTAAASAPVQQLYCNAILATLGNMSTAQLQQLNHAIDAHALVEQRVGDETRALVAAQTSDDDETNVESATPQDVQRWSFASDSVTSVEGVLLPIFDAANRRWHAANTAAHGRTVLVPSTRQNLRSLALGIASDRAVCLSGPVGCGKTGLVEYVARLTGRVAVPWSAVQSAANGTNATTTTTPVRGTKRNKGGKKRRAAEAEAAVAAALAAEQGLPVDGGAASGARPARSGFLRIQLGDQTDSKMLLGQYRCTDVPGEFVWQAGALTQAVQHGHWLLLEDIDLATQDVCVALAALLETGTLSVPGVNEALRAAPGFQLFVTLRQQKQSTGAQLANLQMLNKYMFVVNMLPLSGGELVEMVGELFPRFATIDRGIVDRMVRVFLKFSCGDHGDGEQMEQMASGDGVGDAVAQPLTEETVRQPSSTSNRLVSTRDLIKWCTRSYGTFADTSEANRFLVLKNAADLFCGYLPDQQRRQAIVAIGAELNIAPGMCDAFAGEHLPQVQLTSEEITVGRVRLHKHLEETEKNGKRETGNDDDDANAAKKQKTDAATYVNVVAQNRRKAPTFSFTRIAVCLMERIAVAVQQNEPVLLVGETGVGKTSSVQYLAHHTQHKLVVVNMNNQSDVSDLIGGFKPVDFAFVLGPLRCEFEALFRRSLSAAKNERFLANVSACFQRGEFVVLIKTMIRTIAMVLVKQPAAAADESAVDAAVTRRWRELNVKLAKLEAQLRRSLNISFAFVPGSLVNCIQRGDWVLLDEINLASAETLECLSTILEPEGSVVLLEKGDLVPVRRHPEFRIFACMNPSTDVGKKELPVGIRNRFTEFYADELERRSDLEILIGDYLRNTGIAPARQSAIAQLYERLRQLARLDLNDGLGNRPVFTLRTLCRALAVCARNLCGSVERNLYESFCLSFLTQLDGQSHAQVLQLIQRTMLTNAKAVLAQQIPRPSTQAGVEHVAFEGYWIETGGRELQECGEYILTDSVRLNLKDLARVVSIGRLPVLLQGPTSAGKTSLIEYVAKRSGNRCMRINNHEHTDLQEYIGTYAADAQGKLSFAEGVLVEAMRHGYWIILDELNLASSDILEALNRVLDDNRELFIAETQTLVRAHPNFMLFATQNPPGLYGGRKALSRAFKNRFIELHFSDIPRAELEVILERRCQIPKSYAQKMVKTMAELHVHRQTTVKSSFTLRDLFRWGNRYTLADKRLLEDSKYDWNQHLVDEGYLALSAKIRADGDVEVIERTLLANFRKRIDVGELFELTPTTSKVTRSILERIAAHPRFERIVWTFNMRRMAVLAAKALEFNEPVLLVGSTGCGKTTVCQILADISGRELRILNCHMHTEGADFLGGLRPYRGGGGGGDGDADTADDESGQKLFEWADGPLVLAMQQGSFFLADEISLAEDSVLERLNCILEPERTVLLSEKGGSSNGAESSAQATSDLSVTAAPGFQFLATMNPGGDYGKKELSPALRNRFTEIWCRATDTSDDLQRIAGHLLRSAFGVQGDARATVLIGDLAAVIVESVFYMRAEFQKFTFSIRDVLAWIEYVTKHARLHAEGDLSLSEALVFGMETLFLDALEMLPHDSVAEIEAMRKKALTFLVGAVRKRLQVTVQLGEIQAAKGTAVELSAERFGIRPFYLERAAGAAVSESAEFVFTAPTTQRNLFCLLSALSLHKPILLEGPPGVGKTSLIEQVTAALGYKIVRINLCEHTDLADLFGSDLPATQDEEAAANQTSDDGEQSTTTKEPSALGSFVWRDGPLLAALKAPDTWILLDELNLAPQSVLEGLNAVLDHRGEVYIPELNKTFKLGAKTRIFASQNPLRQGGGRKGLPLSFLNRFTKVYLRKLQRADLHHVVRVKYAQFFEDVQQRYAGESASVPLCEAMVAFTEALDAGLETLEFGYKGGPFEVNLRDILRWCEFLCGPETGCSEGATFAQFQRTVYEKMKLVYVQRMRTPQDAQFIRAAFAKHFECDAEQLESDSRNVALYWTDRAVYLNDIRCTTAAAAAADTTDQDNAGDVKPRSASAPLLLTAQREQLKNMAECVHMQKPVILCGPTDSGKTKTIDVLCTLINRRCVTDAIDDSVTGAFQQIDLNRHLEELAAQCEELLIAAVQRFAQLQDGKANKAAIVALLAAWERYTDVVATGLAAADTDTGNHSAISADLIAFRERLHALNAVHAQIADATDAPEQEPKLAHIRTRLAALAAAVAHATTLNSGGHFEWVDSRIVTAFRSGRIICLEHVNLCSSAILDRLNPMFEPGGTLLLAEKGVTAADEPEVVRKHERFNAFLTLDPKNGEISRAMRNRCVELNVAREEYEVDDLRTLCWAAGVAEMSVIEAILRVHKACLAVSDFSAMGVAHVTKCADLVRRNRQLGCGAPEALQRAATEVYVRAANVDLTGFGLAFYRQQLRTAIAEVVDTMVVREDLFDYANVVERADALDAFALVRKQCEVFLTVLRALVAGLSAEDVGEQLRGLFAGFGAVELDCDGLTLRLLLGVIYECAAPADLELRRVYLAAAFDRMQRDHPENATLAEMRAMNQQLFDDITAQVVASPASDLPWNTQIFPRLQRFYQPTERLTASAQLRLSALVAARSFLQPVLLGTGTKLSTIDALTFSHAVHTKRMQNVPGEELVRLLWTYVAEVQPQLVEMLEQAESGWQLDAEDAVELVAAMLWHNRLYACTQRQLFTADKRIDDALVNLIARHIKWLEKHLIARLPHDSPATPFARTRSAMATVVRSAQHPLHQLRKRFVRTMCGFLPHYSAEQIAAHEQSATFERQTALTPRLGATATYERDVAQRRLAAVCDELVQQLKRHLVQRGRNVELTAQRLLCATDVDLSAIASPLASSHASFVAEMRTLASDDDEVLDSSDFDASAAFEHLAALLERDDLRPDRFVAELLPLREFFALKALNAVLADRHAERPLNAAYFDSLQSLGLNELRALRTIRSPEFAACERLWHSLWQRLNEGGDTWTDALAALPTDFYRNYASVRRSLHAQLQQFAQRSLAVRPCQRDGSSEQWWAGPMFTTATLAALYDAYGAPKSCGLVQLPAWQASLSQMAQLLWTNADVASADNGDFSFEHAQLNAAWQRAHQLLHELQAVFEVFNRKHTATTEGSEFIGDFQQLVDTLKHLHRQAQPALERVPQTPSERSVSVRLSAALAAQCGAIEIHLLTYLPLLDPVAKERLKQLYRREDQRYLRKLTQAIECMQITMAYADLGAGCKRPVEQKLAAIEGDAAVQSVPLRPVECVYAALRKDIGHFVQTCCQPRALGDLFATVAATLDAENASTPACQEAAKRTELWCSNAAQFVHHTLPKYAAYYRDFVEPLCQAVTLLTHGLKGLRHCLNQRCAVAGNEASLNALLGNLIEFPSVDGLRLLPAKTTSNEDDADSETISRVLSASDAYDAHYLRLLKVKLHELEHRMSLGAATLTPTDVHSINALLALFNGVWKQQEDRRRRHAEEEESLYVTKTRCAEEDDEEVAVREVQSMFPNTIEADFGDLLDAVTLEQKPEATKTARDGKPIRTASALVDLLKGEDISEICSCFARIMQRYTQSYYYRPKLNGNHVEIGDCAAAEHDYVADFKARVSAFADVFPRFAVALNSAIDERVYTGAALLVGDRMAEMNMLRLSEAPAATYNFYTDSNIAEVITCNVVLRKIEARAAAELALYPEHAGLLDIVSIIRRIESFATTSPVMRFSSGFQILNKKLNEWNKLASRHNTMIDLEVEVGGYIQRWMKLELQCWRECLSQSLAKVQQRAHRYWFFVYNLVQEYLSYDRKRNVLQCDLTDFAQVERNFDGTSEEVAVDATLQDTTTRMRSVDVVRVLKQFIESANYADFAVRMRILKAFEQYLYQIRGSELAEKRRNTLITIMHNLHVYFAQFAGDVEARLKAQRAGVEKKLKEFVKMESYSKYLSYFSQDANIAQVHRKLHKFLKEFEQQAGERISAVFVLKDAQLGDVKAAAVAELSSASAKKNAAYLEAQRRLHLVEVGTFVCASRSAEFFAPLAALGDVCAADSLLLRADRMFARSRNIVKHTLLHSPYQPLIYHLHQLLGDQLESLDYLRGLQVDRTQEKPKQKVQAKQILQQKRKALTDFYKVLTRLGFSYRAGLLEAGLTAELSDLRIAPFCVRTMVATGEADACPPRLQPALLALDNKLHEYFVRGVYKLKVLQTVLLTPHADVGTQHLERIKGFGVDVFVLVQQQRKALGEFVRQLNDLREHVHGVGELQRCSSAEGDDADATSYEQLRQRYARMRLDLARVCDVVLQYQLLFKCAPTVKAADCNRVLAQADSSVERNAAVRESCATVLAGARALIADLVQQEEFVFYAPQTVRANDEQYAKVCEAIDGLANAFASGPSTTSVFGRAVVELQERLRPQSIERTDANDGEVADEFANANTEIENMIHAMLYAMQSVYKRHSDHELEAGGEAVSAKPATEEVTESTEEPDPIQLNHLKVLVTHGLHTDVELLSVPKVCQKLGNILLTIRHSTNVPGRRAVAQRLLCVLPILEQYQRLCLFFLVQQLSAHKVSAKMMATLLTVFVELGAKGFCVPPDLMEDGEEGEQKQETGSEGFGLEDGTGEKDVSDKLESEDQLDSAQKPGDDKDTDDKEDADCKEEKGIDMSDDFDSKLQDLDKKEPNSDDSDQEDDDEQPDKQMDKTEDGAEKLDDQIWGSDEEKDEEEDDDKEMNEEDEGKGSKEEDEKHNDLANQNNETKQNDDDEQKEGLDAADNEQEKKKKEKDIDQMDEPDVGEDQANPYHNDLEEPPEPEDVDLGDNFNLDKEDANDQDDRQEENPFDIDTMKDQMEVDENEEEENPDGDAEADDKAEDGKDADGDDSDSGDEKDDDKDKDESKEDEAEDGDTKRDDEQPTEEEQPADPDEPAESQVPAPMDEEAQPEEAAAEEEPKPQPNDEDYHQSKDKPSAEDNVQSMPEQQKDKGSLDQVQKENQTAEPQKQQDMDAQDTGEDNEAIGQAENEESKSGHQGVAETKETNSAEQQQKQEAQEKRKQGNTDEERTLGDPDQQEKKQLKTIDKVNKNEQPDKEPVADDAEPEAEAEEYQHVKEAKPSDKTTLDNATEEQSKRTQHEDEADDKDEPMDTDEPAGEDQLADDDAAQPEEDDATEQLTTDETDINSDKPSTKRDRQRDETAAQQEEPIEVEGDYVDTCTVPRAAESTAHTAMDLLQDKELAAEPTQLEQLEMRRMFETERQAAGSKLVAPQVGDFEVWNTIANKMLPNARELCEQLRLILEPTKCTRLKGDYRTGRRINLKKIIPYIASQFRKDKIWLRRTKPAQRDYKITVAIDDSKSMAHNQSKQLTLEAIALVSQALTLLESGRLSVMSFGERPKIVLDGAEQFDGPKLCAALTFEQNQSRIAELMHFARVATAEQGGSGGDGGVFENLLLVLSDGRNIFSEGEQVVRNAVKLARMQRMFIVYVIIDNPENKSSILDIRVPMFAADRKSMTFKAYLDTFPFPYYVIVRDLAQLPLVLSDAMRQWFELVNSEQ